MRLLSSAAPSGSPARKGRAVAALGLAVGLVLPLAACSSDEDEAPVATETTVAPVEPTEEATTEAEEEATPEATETEAEETTEPEAPAETTAESDLPTDSLKLIKVLRRNVNDLRDDAESLPGEAKSRTFKALGKTDGALGKSTGSVKAARNGNPKADKQIDIAMDKIEYAQEALQEAMLKLEGHDDDTSVTMSADLKTLAGDLDNLREALTKE